MDEKELEIYWKKEKLKNWLVQLRIHLKHLNQLSEKLNKQGFRIDIKGTNKQTERYSMILPVNNFTFPSVKNVVSSAIKDIEEEINKLTKEIKEI